VIHLELPIMAAIALAVGLALAIGTNLLFPTPTGKLWRDRNFNRDVWYQARDAYDWRVVRTSVATPT
jgi:hypothetical protein